MNGAIGMDREDPTVLAIHAMIPVNELVRGFEGRDLPSGCQPSNAACEKT